MESSADSRAPAPWPAEDRDRADLLAVLERRLGPVPQSLVAAIGALADPGELDRLILAAANAAGWREFATAMPRAGLGVGGSPVPPPGEHGVRGADRSGGGAHHG